MCPTTAVGTSHELSQAPSRYHWLCFASLFNPLDDGVLNMPEFLNLPEASKPRWRVRLLRWLFVDDIPVLLLGFAFLYNTRFGIGLFIAGFGTAVFASMSGAVGAAAVWTAFWLFVAWLVDLLLTSFVNGGLIARVWTWIASDPDLRPPPTSVPATGTAGTAPPAQARRGLPARDRLSRLRRVLAPAAVMSAVLVIALGAGAAWRAASGGIAVVLPALLAWTLFGLLVILIVLLSLRDEGFDADHPQTDYTRLRNRRESALMSWVVPVGILTTFMIALGSEVVLTVGCCLLASMLIGTGFRPALVVGSSVRRRGRAVRQLRLRRIFGAVAWVWLIPVYWPLLSDPATYPWA